MSEFERSDEDSAWADARELKFPEDFSKEEAAFARQMREIFAVEHEELPPLYVQTLLEDDRCGVPDAQFEQRIVTQVFDSLHLSPPAADSHLHRAGERYLAGARMARSHRRSILDRVRARLLAAYSHANRAQALAMSLFLLLIVLALMAATPTFAQGLREILGQTGVVQVKGAPAAGPSPSSPQKHASKRAGSADPAVTFDPRMPLFWLGTSAGPYSYEDTQLEQATAWSKGAIVDIQYGLSSTSAGSGLLDIREFQVNSSYSAVLQVVENGYANSVTLSDGELAVYVNGMWQQRIFDHTRLTYWQTGTHSLLIMERQGVVIWITGDPRDGLNTQTMANIASQLTQVSQAMLLLPRHGIWSAGVSLAVSVNDPQGTELYLLVPQGISPASGAGQFVFSGSGPDVNPDSGS